MNWWQISQPVEMLTLGIDPGTANLGWGLVSGDSQPRLVSAGAVRPPRGADLGSRLEAIDAAINELLGANLVTDLALERQTFARNVTTASATFCACGVVILAAKKHGLRVAEYSPAEIKSAVTGSGNASKSDVQQLLKAILRVEHLIEPSHAADAVAAAICHIHNRDIERGLSRRVG